jgi:hypothetical protein
MIKYSSIILFAALIFCLQSFGQIANRAETDTSRLLINKWVITALEMQGKKANLPADSKDFFEFKSDGTGTISELGRLHSVLWDYDKTAGRLNIDGQIYVISKINKFQLVIFGMDGKDKITIYFKGVNSSNN